MSKVLNNIPTEIVNEPHVSKQSAISILDVLDASRSPALKFHPLHLHEETGLITVFDADLKLAEEYLEEPSHSLKLHTLKAFLSSFERPLEVVAWIRAQ